MLLHRKPLLKRERDCRRSSGDKRERKKIGALPFHLVTRDSWKRCDDHFVWRGNTAAKVSPKIPGRSTAKQELSSSSRAAHRYCENFSASSEARRKASSNRGNTFGKRCAAACAISCKRLRHQVSRQHLRPGSGDRRPRRSLLCELRHPVDERLPPSRGIHLPTPKRISARWSPLGHRRPSALGFPSCRLGRRGSPSRCSDQPATAPTMDRLLRFLQGSLLPENSGIRHRPPRLGQLAHLVRSLRLRARRRPVPGRLRRPPESRLFLSPERRTWRLARRGGARELPPPGQLPEAPHPRERHLFPTVGPTPRESFPMAGLAKPPSSQMVLRRLVLPAEIDASPASSAWLETRNRGPGVLAALARPTPVKGKAG